MMNDDEAWFRPKRYGYGAGMPIRWQGWTTLGVYVLAVLAASLLIERTVVGYVAVVLVLTLVIVVICARRTLGGWRWRWGED